MRSGCQNPRHLAPLPAQTRARTVPKVFAGCYATRASIAPLGRTRVLFQTWYRGDNLKLGFPILELGWRVHNTVSASAQARPSDPDQPALWIKGDRPFVFVGPHFLVQVDVQSTTQPTDTGYNCNAFTMAATAALFTNAERSCGGANLQGSYAPAGKDGVNGDQACGGGVKVYTEGN